VLVQLAAAAAATALRESPRQARRGGAVAGDELEGQAGMQNCFSSRQSLPY
jgi:hypothetical protein